MELNNKIDELNHVLNSIQNTIKEMVHANTHNTKPHNAQHPQHQTPTPDTPNPPLWNK